MNIISPVKLEGAISADEMSRRRKALARADAHNRIEGLYRDPRSNEVYQDFIEGKIELDEILPRIKALTPHL